MTLRTEGSSSSNTNQQTHLHQYTHMKSKTNHLRSLGVAAALAAAFTPVAQAAIDTQYNDNDLMFFGLKKTGTAWVDNVVTFSLGSTYNVFRKAATPGDPTYGTVISLGNINTILTSSYGADWTTLPAETLYFGAAGQNASTANIGNAVLNGDHARTAYITSPRLGAGTYGESNSNVRNIATSLASGTVTQIASSNGSGGALNQSTPLAINVSDTQIDNQNPLTPSGNPATAYTSINAGVVGAASSSTYNYDTINNVVIGLDLFRITPSLSGASAWQNVNSITQDYGGSGNGFGFYLGTITLSSNGDVNFVGTGATPIPEPGTVAAAVLLAAGAWLRWRKRPQVTA